MNYTNDLKIDISQLNEQLRRLKAGINDASKAFKNSISVIKDWTNNANGINLKIKEQKEILDKNNKVLDTLYDKYKTLSKDKNVSFSTLKNLNDEIEKQKAIINKNVIAITDYQEQLKKLATFDATDIATSLNEKVSVLAKSVVNNLGNAIKNTIKSSISEGLSFENAFAGVRKVTDGTEEQLKDLETQIRKTSLEKPISQDQLASIYQMGSQLGIARNDLKDFSDTIIDLAKTSNLTEEAGASMLAQYANVMHLPSEEYRRFASTLSYLGSKTATTENDIMNLASRISGTASILGMAHKDLLALSTAMGSVGITAESGGSAISTIMQYIDKQLATNGKNVQTWAEVAEMSVKDFSNLWKTDLMSAIQKIMTGMADAKKGGENLNVILKELGVSSIRQITTMQKLASASELLNDCIDKANTEWEKNTFLTNSSNEIYNTLGSQMQLLSNSFREIKLSIFENLKEPMQDAFKAINDLIKSPEIKNAISNFAKQLGNVIKIFFGNAEKIKKILKSISVVLAAIMAGAFFTKTILIVANIVNVFKQLKTAIEAAKVAQTALNLAMNANVIGTIVTVVLSLISALAILGINLSNTSDKVKENIKVLEDQHKQLVENREERERTIAGIDAEAKKTQGLVDELKILVDENGKVKEGYRGRVDEIIPLIEKATGTEIKLIDDQIDKYGELMSTLDKVIAKKRLEAKINAYQEDYNNAWKVKESNEKAITELNDQQALYDEYQELLKNKMTWGEDEKARYEQIKEEFSDLGINVRNLKQLDEFKNNLEKSRQEIAASEEEIAGVIDKYESLIVEEYESNKYDPEKDQTLDQLKEKEKQYKEQLEKYKTAIKNGSKDIKYEMVNSVEQELSTIQSKIKKMEELAYGKSGASSNVVTGSTDSGFKSGTKKSTSKKEETHTSYQELLNQEKAYQTQLQNYLTAIKQGNSEITVEMVEDTKKKLDEVQKKVKDMKQLLGDNTVTTKLVLDDETYGGLNKKREELAKQLKDMQNELAKGNQNITQDMLNNVGKQIDQIDAKIKNLKNEWDESGNDGEISDEFESENTDHKSTGVIFGKGVIGENAVEMVGAGKDAASAYLDAFEAEKERRNNELVVQAKNQAQQEALSYQEATIDPNNLAVYDTTEKMLAESKQTSQAQGLTDNAYKVIDAETWTLNTAIEEAKKIDFKVVGLHICQGIADGIRENAHMVISAVRAMMAEANATAETEEEIESPSKVFYKYGRFMDIGMANGIKDYAKLVSNQVQAMTSRANEAIGLANSHMNAERYGNMQAFKGTGNTNINYNFTQNNTSNKSLDTLAIYQESKSMLKRAIRNQYV